MQTKWIFFIT